VPSLREFQTAMRAQLLNDSNPVAAAIVAAALAPADRVSIYRNTSRVALTNALRLNYPAVQQLVGEDFFAAAADIFITSDPPRMAWLDFYGAEFPEFLGEFAPAASLRYLSDVARLERAVSRALHAADCETVTPAQLASIDPAAAGRICFTPHPSIGLLSSDYPVDAIWRAVLASDDAAIAAVDLGAGPVWLVVERNANSLEVTRIDEQRWRFAEALFAGEPLAAALETADSSDAPAWLAAHLAAAHFIRFAPAEAAHTPATLGHRQ
jgi:Putative DNA-binding domain